MKHLVVLAGSAAVLLGVVACGGPTPGQPTPATGANGGGPAASSSSPSGGPQTSTSGAGSLPVNQPCSLLSSSDLQQINVSSQPTQDMVGTAHDCSLTTPADSVGVAIRTNAGLAAFQPTSGTVHGIRIGTHQAKQVIDNTGSCVIAIGVSDSSRVDVTATGDGTTDPCPTARTVAQLVEPKLP